MQVVLRGVMHYQGLTCISFEGPDIPFKPYWFTYLSSIALDSVVPWGQFLSWYPSGVSTVVGDNPSHWQVPQNNPDAWAIYTALGDEGLPIPVRTPDPVWGSYPFVLEGDTYQAYSYLGYTFEGYALSEGSPTGGNSLDNLTYMADGAPDVSPSEVFGGDDFTFTIKAQYEDAIRNCDTILYTQTASSAGYEPTQSSIGFVDIIDGGDIRTIDLSTAEYLSAASEAQTSTKKGSAYDPWNDSVSFRISRATIGVAPPDIFWTQRILCEETQ